MTSEEAAVKVAAGKGEGKGGKGNKGASKGAPPPAPSAKSKAASKAPAAKAQGPNIWDVFTVFTRVQKEDGSIDFTTPDAEKESLWRTAASGERLREDHFKTKDPVYNTLVYIEILKNVAAPMMKREEKVLTKMGNGRDVENEYETVTTEVPLEEVMERLFESGYFKTCHGTAGLAKAQEYLETQKVDPERKAEVAAWVKENVHAPGSTVKKKTGGLSKEELQKREEARKQKEAEAREKAMQEAEHWKSLVSASIYDVDWSKFKKMKQVDGGHGGCHLVELEGGQALCLKPQREFATAEFLAERVLKALEVPVAASRVALGWTKSWVAPEEREYMKPVIEEAEAMAQYVWEYGWPVQVAVLEFVPGHTLVGLDAQVSLKGETAEQIYASLGRICAGDALLNNMDRIPLPLWTNDGNLGNVMVSKAGEVKAIDQQINLIMEGPGLDNYMKRLKEQMLDAKSGAKSKTAAALTKALMENTGTEPTEAQLLTFTQEMGRTFERAASLVGSGEFERVLVEAQAECYRIFGAFPMEMGQSRIEAMVDFVRAVGQQVSQIIFDSVVASA